MKHNLGTLSILYYVYGAFTCLIGVVILILVLMGIMLNTDLVQGGSDAPPAFVGSALQIIGWVLFAIIEAIGILKMLSGRWIARRINRTGSLIIAGSSCLSFPLGTALGVFSFVVLTNPEVQKEYEAGGSLLA